MSFLTIIMWNMTRRWQCNISRTDMKYSSLPLPNYPFHTWYFWRIAGFCTSGNGFRCSLISVISDAFWFRICHNRTVKLAGLHRCIVSNWYSDRWDIFQIYLWAFQNSMQILDGGLTWVLNSHRATLSFFEILLFCCSCTFQN